MSLHIEGRVKRQRQYLSHSSLPLEESLAIQIEGPEVER